jgi:hypothetical protein
MAEDKLEKGSSSRSVKRKKQTEPFVMLSLELISTRAYIDLSFSARAMLIELVSHYNGNNNGSIWISPNVLRHRGFSKNTATKAFKELITHGFIYMTKRGGNQRGGCSLFAITWTPINQAIGQYLNNFQANAFKKWEPTSEKIWGQILGHVIPKNGRKARFH